MSDNINSTLQSSFHQRSQSMPLRNTFINNNEPPLYQGLHETTHRNYNFNSMYRSLKQDSGISQENNDNFPISTSSKLTYSQFRSVTVSDDEKINANFFHPSRLLLNVFDKNSNLQPINLECKLTKGFFKSESHWTCYRRNYFQVSASLSIPNYSELERYALHIGPDNDIRYVRQFSVNIRACVNGEANADVRLTQMTPKRDKGPIREPPMIPIHPTNYVTFERLQFKAATANNGRRKASQQFFCLVIELRAQLEDDSQHIIATSHSRPLVVRGRSPGHYNCDKKVKTPVKRETSPQKSNSTDTPIPQPTYVYSPPSTMVSEPSDSGSTSNVLPLSVPQMLLHGFGNPHGRSQSANDPQFIARHRKYQTKLTEPYQQSLFHDDSMAGIDKALRQWELQTAKYKEEPTSAFHSYTMPEGHDGSEASTPIPYNQSIESDRSLYSQPHDWRLNNYST